MMEKRNCEHRTVSDHRVVPGSQGCLPADLLGSTLPVTDRLKGRANTSKRKASQSPHSCNTLLDVLFPSALKDQMFFFPCKYPIRDLKNK